MNDHRIALLSNPGGGYNRRAGLETLDRVAHRIGIPHYRAKKPEDIAAALTAMAREKPDIVAINGGDGTVDLAITLMRNRHMFEREPGLMLLRGGTTNMIHRDCGMSDRPARALLRYIREGGTTVERRPLEVTAPLSSPRYGFFIGTGAIPRAALAMRSGLHRRRGMTGKIGETIAIAALLTRLKFARDLQQDAVLAPSRLLCELDGVATDADHIFMGLTSLKKLIGNRTINAPEGQIGIIGMNADRRLRTNAASSVRIGTDASWMLDGKIYPAGHIDVRLGRPIVFHRSGK